MKKIIRRCMLLNRIVEQADDCANCNRECQNPGGKGMKRDRPTHQVIVK